MTQGKTTWSLKPGYAYRRRDGETEWEIVVLPKAEEGNRRLVAMPVEIDGSPCAVFAAGEGVMYAQTLVASVDVATVGDGTEPQPLPEKGGK